jgi:hypothetical protein
MEKMLCRWSKRPSPDGPSPSGQYSNDTHSIYDHFPPLARQLSGEQMVAKVAANGERGNMTRTLLY